MRAAEIPNPNQYFNQRNPDFYKSEYWKKPFDRHTTSVGVIPHNPVYLGQIAFGKERRLTINAKTTAKMPKDEWIIAEDTHEPIIRRKQWDLVHDMLKRRKREDSNGAVQMFAGLPYTALTAIGL